MTGCCKCAQRVLADRAGRYVALEWANCLTTSKREMFFEQRLLGCDHEIQVNGQNAVDDASLCLMDQGRLFSLAKVDALASQKEEIGSLIKPKYLSCNPI